MSANSSDQERTFLIELKSKNAIKNFSFCNGKREDVSIEGTLGSLRGVTFLEGVLLEVVGTEGLLRLDLRSEELPRK